MPLSPKRQALKEKRELARQAKESYQPHPFYPGLEHAKLNRAQFKFVHVVSNLYYRIHARGLKVAHCKGIIHPTQHGVISEYETDHWNLAEAKASVNETMLRLLAEGYIWERNLTTKEEISAEAFENMIMNLEVVVSSEQAQEKFKHFEKHFKF